MIYSGPTSLNEADGKNFMYLKNLNFFLRHGVSCSSSDVDIDYIIVLTEDVAGYYTSPDGPITKKILSCGNEVESARANKKDIYESSIEVIVRQNRCYDMESIRVVSEQKDLRSQYDNLVFVNCGMAGPKVGPNSPVQSGRHWTHPFTSLLSHKIRMSGLSINGCLKKKCRPHIQSFLYAISTETLHMLLANEGIYDCGDDNSRVMVIHRYEIGMSRILLDLGYSLAVPYMNNLEMGKSLIINKDNLDLATNDLWLEDSLRNATMAVEDSVLKRLVVKGEADCHRRDILPWDFYMFFKASRFVPYDIQSEMEYDLDLLDINKVPVVPNRLQHSADNMWSAK